MFVPKVQQTIRHLLHHKKHLFPKKRSLFFPLGSSNNIIVFLKKIGYT